jgi:hypothetical protein
MSEYGSFDELMARLRAGDEDAESQIFQEFASRLSGLARQRLDSRLRQASVAGAIMSPQEQCLRAAVRSPPGSARDGHLRGKPWP